MPIQMDTRTVHWDYVAGGGLPASKGDRLLLVDLDATGRPLGPYAGDPSLLHEAAAAGMNLDQRGRMVRLPSVLLETVSELLQTPEVAQRASMRVRLQAERGHPLLLDVNVLSRDTTSSEGSAAYTLVIRELRTEPAQQRLIARLAQVATSTTNLVIVTDAQRRIEWVNQAFTRTTGYSLEEVRGRQPGELLQCEDTDAATVKRIRDALDARSSVQAVILNRGKHGRRYWLSLDIQPVLRSDGAVEAFIAVQSDITPSIEQSERLELLAVQAQSARATLLSAVNALPVGFALFDGEERLAMCNDQYRSLHPTIERRLDPGVGLQDLLEAEIACGAYPSARGQEQHWLASRLQALREGRGWDFELELADGRWVKSTKIRTEDGQTIALRSDITALKRSEKSAVTQLIATMDASLDAVALAGPDGRINFVNAALARLVGGAASTWGGKDWSLLCHPADRQAFVAAADSALRDRGVWRGTMRMPRLGSPGPMQEVTLTRVPDGSLVLIARDISQLEQALQQETLLHDLLMTIASRYLNTPLERVDAAIEAGLGELARFVDADRGYLFEYDWEAGTTSNTHEWCVPGVEPQRQHLQRLALEDFEIWTRAHLVGDSIHVADTAELAPGSALRELLSSQGIKSLVAIPMMDGTRCEGFLGFDFVRRHHRYSSREHSLLSFFSEISRSLRQRSRLEIQAREVRRQLAQEEERGRLQKALDLQRVESETRLKRALVETQRLHDRDREVRRASELMVSALQSLSESRDPSEGPALLLKQLADAMGSSSAAILPLESSEEPIRLERDGWWSGLLNQPAIVGYMATKRFRLIADLRAVPAFAPMSPYLASDGYAWMTSALIGTARRGVLLAVAGSARDPLDQNRIQLFVRFVPLVVEALRRRRESLRARKLESDLQQSQKLEALGALAGSIAHEINTPMQYISDNLHFLRDALGTLTSRIERHRGADLPGSPEDQDLDYLLKEVPLALEQSLNGSRRVAEIVDAVRSIAYPDLAPDETVHLRSTLEHCLVITRGNWKHDIDVSLLGDRSVPVVRGSPGQISQVFVNLTNNACDAVRQRRDGHRGVVHIRLTSQPGQVRVDVDDNGPGVPLAMRKRIFERFFTTKPLGHGTGRGLDICRAIVERHGGTIVVQDSPLGGARFTVLLPVGDAATEASPKSSFGPTTLWPALP